MILTFPPKLSLTVLNAKSYGPLFLTTPLKKIGLFINCSRTYKIHKKTHTLKPPFLC